LHLPDALNGQATVNIVEYCRVSSWGQSSNGSLDNQALAVHRAIREFAAPEKLKVRWIVRAVELGKLSAKRPGLREALKVASKYTAILVARDLARFLRSESYGPKNRIAEPTAQEVAELLAMADGVLLATIEPPTLTEWERHSRATKASGKCGRPRKIGHELAYRVLESLGLPFFGESGRIEWEVPLSAVAKRFRLTKALVQRLVDSPIPGKSGRRWKDVWDPAYAYLTAWELGQLRE
jgi:hypothetical protein